MKVHPMPRKRNNVTIQYYTSNSIIDNDHHRRDPSSGGSHSKKLRRLPHIFSRVLELPFRSDADVSVEENPDCFRFVAETDNIGEVRAHTIEIHPGVTKIVIRPNGFLELSSLDGLELDMWRFRLPESTRPELASAILVDGELIVTVPKGDDEAEEGNGNNGEFVRVRPAFSALHCNTFDPHQRERKHAWAVESVSIIHDASPSNLLGCV